MGPSGNFWTIIALNHISSAIYSGWPWTLSYGLSYISRVFEEGSVCTGQRKIIHNHILPILYWIRFIRWINWIQLEPFKVNWRLLKVFLSLQTISWFLCVMLMIVNWWSIDCIFKPDRSLFDINLFCHLNGWVRLIF